MQQEIKKIEETIEKSSLWEKLKLFLNEHIDFSQDISISVKDVIIIITVIFITTLILRLFLRVITRRLPADDKAKFKVVFGYFRWLIYLVIFLITIIFTMLLKFNFPGDIIFSMTGSLGVLLLLALFLRKDINYLK